MELRTLTRSKFTPTDVLEILRDEHRHLCQIDDAVDRDFDVSLDRTIAEWRDACDLLGWYGLAEALDREWQCGLHLFTWKGVLVPPKKRTLRDLCELIARYAPAERVKAPTVMGRQCDAAGVFFAVREILARAGADVSHLKPSTPVADFAIKYWRTFVGPISSLAPGALPPVTIEYHPHRKVISRLPPLSFIVLVASFILAQHEPILGFFVCIPAIGMTAAAWVLDWYTASHWKPVSVTFGKIQTFRELCMTLAPKARMSTP